MTGPSTPSFGLLVDQLREQHVFAEGFFACAFAVVASASRPYVASPESASKTRQALGALGVSDVPGPRSRRLTAAERAELEAVSKARSIGFVRGRFVG